MYFIKIHYIFCQLPINWLNYHSWTLSKNFFDYHSLWLGNFNWSWNIFCLAKACYCQYTRLSQVFWPFEYKWLIPKHVFGERKNSTTYDVYSKFETSMTQYLHVVKIIIIQIVCIMRILYIYIYINSFIFHISKLSFPLYLIFIELKIIFNFPLFLNVNNSYVF